jgi:hypothetical protein
MSSNEATPPKSITDVVGVIVNELSPLEASERRRVIKAALALLGEESINDVALSSVSSQSILSEQDDTIPPRARTWMRQHGLSRADIEQVFYFGGEGVEIIAPEIPGTTNREKVRNAYVLLGISELLSSGDPVFEDARARALCEKFGFYDATNHSKYMKGGNEFVGSKEKGWTVTAPGLRHAALLVKQLSKVNE